MTFELNGFSYRYRSECPPALIDVSLRLPTDTVVAVLGMSGSGKSTLLNVLGLLADPGVRAGEVKYFPHADGEAGLSYDGLSAASRARFRRDNFGFVLQSSYLLPNFTCVQNILQPLLLQRKRRAERRHALRRVLKIMKRTDPGLIAHLRQRPAHVSGGQRQRMAVIRAVIHDPHVVFADEPFSSLDPHNTRATADLLLRWQRGELHPNSPQRHRGVILVSHHVRTALEMAPHVLLVHQGRIVGEGLHNVADLPGQGRDLEAASRYIEAQIGPDNHADGEAGNGLLCKASQGGAP